jgi:hypothetical protein
VERQVKLYFQLLGLLHLLLLIRLFCNAIA